LVGGGVCFLFDKLERSTKLVPGSGEGKLQTPVRGKG